MCARENEQMYAWRINDMVYFDLNLFLLIVVYDVNGTICATRMHIIIWYLLSDDRFVACVHHIPNF